MSTQTAQTPRATQAPTDAKPASGANGGQRAAAGAGTRYRPLSARQPNARGAAKRKQAPQPWWRQNAPILGAVIVVVLLVAIFALIAHNANNGDGSPNIGSAAPANVTSALTPKDASVFNTVGTGGLQNPFKHGGGSGSGDFLKGSDGKPMVMYVGAEYCPYCAAERWSTIVALNRFGSFDGLTLSASSATDVFPNTPTFSFVNAHYTSQYITFSSVETEDRTQNTLQTPTAQQQQVFKKYNAPPYLQSGGGIPFISVANQYVTNGSGYQPGILDGLTWEDIAGKLSNPHDPVTQDIVGNANYITAAICQTTNQAPESVCKAAPIPDIEKKL